jgi:hypothetical protein
MSSRQKPGMSGTTRPQTEWQGVEELQDTPPQPSRVGHEWATFVNWCAHGCDARAAKVPRINLVGNSARGLESETFWPRCLGVVPRIPQVGIFQISTPQLSTSQVGLGQIGTF